MSAYPIVNGKPCTGKTVKGRLSREEVETLFRAAFPGEPIPKTFDEMCRRLGAVSGSRPTGTGRESAEADTIAPVPKATCIQRFTTGPKKGEVCGKPAKEGNLCGLHANAVKKGTSSTAAVAPSKRCAAMTKKGTQCANVTTKGDYCNKHKRKSPSPAGSRRLPSPTSKPTRIHSWSPKRSSKYPTPPRR